MFSALRMDFDNCNRRFFAERIPVLICNRDYRRGSFLPSVVVSFRVAGISSYLLRTFEDMYPVLFAFLETIDEITNILGALVMKAARGNLNSEKPVNCWENLLSMNLQASNLEVGCAFRCFLFATS